MKLFFTIFSFILLTGCSSSMLYQYQQTQEEIHFKVSKNKSYHHKLTNGVIKDQFDHCTTRSYTIEDETLFLEHIGLNNNCKWNGSANGFFEYQMKEQLKLKSVTAIERLDKGNYTFSKLKINDERLLYTIHIWSVFNDTFIIDYNGSLTQKLQEELAVQFNDKTILPLFEKRYNLSLVRMNFIKGYFNQESEVIIE